MLIRPYLHREAIVSSRIEGTHSSLSELLLFQAGAQAPREEIREVANYVEALDWGAQQLANLPISLRLVRQLHKRLLEGARGEEKTPGEFRRTQNWIGRPGTPVGDAEFVPPPPEVLPELLDDWEKYIHEQNSTPPLIRCALTHYQFETIHPFIDGNGRIGRLLMPLFLVAKGHLSQPLLYLSAYFERHRADYTGALTRGRLAGDLSSWLNLFLDAVAAEAQDAAERADRLTVLRDQFHRKVQGSRSSVIRRLIDRLFSEMFLTASDAATQSQVTVASVQRAIDALVKAEVLREVTGRQWGRIYVASEILQLIEPSPPTHQPDREQ